MKQAFRKIRLSQDNKEKLAIINSIVEEYQEQGYKLTLRQLYYQLVSRDIIPNNVKEYGKISKILTEGRMAGIVDWEAIEDRVRVPKRPYYCLDIPDALSDTLRDYRRDRMEGQNNYVEVWIEKDALSGVLSRVTKKYGIYILVNRGYSSVSAMYDAFVRFRDKIEEGKRCHIIYLGDHDPSGKDMIRDIESRLVEFLYNDSTIANVFESFKWEGDSNIPSEDFYELADKYYDDDSCFVIDKESGTDEQIFDGLMAFTKYNLTVDAIALTSQQIAKYNPPPNPAKITDSRAAKYIEIYGEHSWEVDALKPEILNSLLENAILQIIDIDKYNSTLELEQKEKTELSTIIDKYK